MALNHCFTLTLGCKNEKQLSDPIELDLEAGNLVILGIGSVCCRNTRESRTRNKISEEDPGVHGRAGQLGGHGRDHGRGRNISDGGQ